MFIPDPETEFLHPGSRIQGLKDPGFESASNSLSILQCCGSGYGIRGLFDLWIRDPE
jgi:hypothetical protein